MVQQASKRLREEDDEQHDADDWVRIGQIAAVHGYPDSDTKRHNIEKESQDL